MEASRQIFWNIGLGPYILYPLAAIAVAILIYAIYRRVRLWRIGKSDNRLDNLGQRVKSFINVAIIDGFLHRRIFGIAPRNCSPKEFYPGIMHALIFWGCVVFLLGSLLDVISHYVVDFMTGDVYLGMSLALNALSIVVLIGVIIAAFRRYVQKPERLDSTPEDAIALALIFIVVLSGLFLEGFRMVASGELAEHPQWSHWSPVGYVIARGFEGFGQSTNTSIYEGLWWFHSALVLGALVYVSLSFSKLSHILI
jgi:nitrate reductase gamma subunit